MLAGPAPLTAIARRAPVELARCSAPVKLSTEELDELIDDVMKNKASSLIIRPYDPEGAWLWSQWSGSLLQLTRWKVLGLAFLAGVNCAVVSNALQARTNPNPNANPNPNPHPNPSPHPNQVARWKEAEARVRGADIGSAYPDGLPPAEEVREPQP